jgi:hypothetical protein
LGTHRTHPQQINRILPLAPTPKKCCKKNAIRFFRGEKNLENIAIRPK